MAAFYRLEFLWPALPFTVGLSSVDICHSTETALLENINGNDMLRAPVMCLSWPSLICLLLSIPWTIFSSTDFNLSAAFQAPSFCGLNLELFVGSDCECQRQEFKTSRCFFWCPAVFSSWSYPLHSVLGSSILFDWNTLCPIQSFADDTQLPQSCLSWSDAHTPQTWPWQTCISDVKAWITQSKLKLRNDTTKAFLMKSNESLFLDTQPTSLRGHIAEIPFTTNVCNLGFMISDISLDNYISGVCCPAYVEIRRVSYIRHYLLKQRELSSIIWSTVCYNFFPGSPFAYPSDLCSGDTHPPLKLLAKAFLHSNGIIFLKSDIFSPPMPSKLR